MGLIEKIFNNPTMQEAAFGAIRKMMNEAGATHVVLELKPDGGFNFQMLQGAPVVYSQETNASIQETFDLAHNKISELKNEIEVLKNICLDQERQITNFNIGQRFGQLEQKPVNPTDNESEYVNPTTAD